jgi:cbb3-type cytochrome oxidase cytochrome c subunit
MPPYAWLLERRIDPADVTRSVRALQRVGVPYSDTDIDGVPAALETQARAIVARLAEAQIQAEPELEIVALTAYLQRLGQDGRRAIDAGLTAPTGGQ